MCRGNQFSATEIAALLSHPVLATHVENVVFVAAGTEFAAGY